MRFFASAFSQAMRVGPSKTHDDFLLGCLHAENAADGIGQLRLIQRVEMELVEAFGREAAATCSASTAAAISLRVSGSSSRPS